MKKLYSLFLAVVMMFAMATTAMAADVTVLFTQNGSFADDEGTYWLYSEEELYPGGTVSIESLTGCAKSYVPEGVTNPMGDTPSVMDAILAVQPTYKFDLGWGNEYKDPDTGEVKLAGAYISNVNDTALESDYGFNDDGTMWMSGTSFLIGFDYGNGEVIMSDKYVSNVGLQDGMIIYVDLAPYGYASIPMN